jgi:hypothetical protein
MDIASIPTSPVSKKDDEVTEISPDEEFDELSKDIGEY